MIRIAAVGDVHLGEDSLGRVRHCYEDIEDSADVLLLAGDLTRLGTQREAAVVANELGNLPVPTVAVLGNHDYQSDEAEAVIDVLCDAGIELLEGTATVVTVQGETLGVAGTKGFGGGFVGACATEFGEAEMKAFVRHSRALAEQLAGALDSLETTFRVSLTHYAPCDMTLAGEPAAIHPFLGSYLLGEAVDGELGNHAADLALHGHAHRGTERGVTSGGVRVRNVAQPVLERPYQVYCIGQGAPPDIDCTTPSSEAAVV